jgi:hypothetical protein
MDVLWRSVDYCLVGSLVDAFCLPFFVCGGGGETAIRPGSRAPFRLNATFARRNQYVFYMRYL